MVLALVWFSRCFWPSVFWLCSGSVVPVGWFCFGFVLVSSDFAVASGWSCSVSVVFIFIFNGTIF